MEWFEGSKVALNGVEHLSGFPAWCASLLMGWFFIRGVLETVADVARFVARKAVK